MSNIMSTPAVSVCMATYNGERYLSEQLDSILKQLGPGDELVISDDHSADQTVNILKRYRDPRIRFIYNNAERGYTRNFENAIRNATGDIVVISDQDDVWLDDKLAVMKRALEQADVAVSDATHVNEALEVTRGSHFAVTRVKPGFFRQLVRPRYIGACMAFRREVLEKLLPFPAKAEYCPYDFWITLVGECFYRIRLVDEQLILYRRHGGNASTAGMESQNPLLRKLLIRGYSLFALTCRTIARPRIARPRIAGASG